MKKSIFEKARAALGLGVRRIGDTILPRSALVELAPLLGEWDIKVVRADGSVERKTIKNIVTRSGMNRLANRGVQATGTSVGYVICVGTNTAAHSADSAQGNIGEVIRKTSNFTGAGAQSREWLFLQDTFGGASDSLTGIALDSAAICDFPTSSNASGIFFNIINGMGVTLAASDLLDLTVRIRVGSHNLSHST